MLARGGLQASVTLMAGGERRRFVGGMTGLSSQSDDESSEREDDSSDSALERDESESDMRASWRGERVVGSVGSMVGRTK